MFRYLRKKKIHDVGAIRFGFTVKFLSYANIFYVFNLFMFL